MELTGIFAGLLLLTNLYAIVRTVRSEVTTQNKTVWIAGVLLVPVVGAVTWILFGPS
jgi:biotin transporter BioY